MEVIAKHSEPSVQPVESGLYEYFTPENTKNTSQLPARLLAPHP
jgi:hypothetical protein